MSPSTLNTIFNRKEFLSKKFLPKAAQGFFLKLPWAAQGRPRLFPIKSLGQSLGEMGPMASRVSLGQARSAQGSRPRHIVSTEFGALWVSLVPLGNTRPHFCSAQGPPKAAPKALPRVRRGCSFSEKIRAEARLAPKARPRHVQDHRPRLTAQGSPKASPKAPPKAPSPKASLGQALGKQIFCLYDTIT